MDLGILTWVYSKLEANIHKQDALIQKTENCRDELLVNSQASTTFYTEAIENALINEDFKEYFKDITFDLRKLVIAAKAVNYDLERKHVFYNGFTFGQIKNTMLTYAHHIDAKLPALKKQTKKWSRIGMMMGFIMLLLMAYYLYNDFGHLYQHVKKFFIGSTAIPSQKPFNATFITYARGNVRRF